MVIIRAFLTRPTNGRGPFRIRHGGHVIAPSRQDRETECDPPRPEC